MTDFWLLPGVVVSRLQGSSATEFDLLEGCLHLDIQPLKSGMARREVDNASVLFRNRIVIGSI